MKVGLALLRKAAVENRLAHLLLFHGSGTEEREQAGLELACLLNCQADREKPCRQCPACKKIKSGNHPDVYVLKPFKQSIGIEQIISLQEKIYRKHYEGKYKVYLIEEADKLTLPAANALLKIAEEPPENTIIILSTGNAEGIIPTLYSRSQAVYFPSPSAEEWTGSNASPENQDKTLYLEAFKMSGGDPDLARRILQLGINFIKEWLEKYLEAVRTGDFLKVFSLFPLEKEESLVLLQALAAVITAKIDKEPFSPSVLPLIKEAIEAVRKQANHRLVIEVLVLKHIKLGGTQIG